MNRAAKNALRVVGVFSIALAALGLWYNASSLSSVLSSRAPNPEMPYFKPAFLTMSLVCIACYVLLLILGVKLLRLRTQCCYLFAGLLFFEIVYFFSIGILWVVPARNFARSVAAATGVANGGLMFQFIILFPLWAPFLVIWAHKRLRSQ